MEGKDVSEILNGTFSKFYIPSENLAIDEIITSFKGKVIFTPYIPKESMQQASKF
jgi:hypothetical protein